MARNGAWRPLARTRYTRIRAGGVSSGESRSQPAQATRRPHALCRHHGLQPHCLRALARRARRHPPGSRLGGLGPEARRRYAGERRLRRQLPARALRRTQPAGLGVRRREPGTDQPVRRVHPDRLHGCVQPAPGDEHPGQRRLRRQLPAPTELEPVRGEHLPDRGAARPERPQRPRLLEQRPPRHRAPRRCWREPGHVHRPHGHARRQRLRAGGRQPAARRARELAAVELAPRLGREPGQRGRDVRHLHARCAGRLHLPLHDRPRRREPERGDDRARLGPELVPRARGLLDDREQPERHGSGQRAGPELGHDRRQRADGRAHRLLRSADRRGALGRSLQLLHRRAQPRRWQRRSRRDPLRHRHRGAAERRRQQLARRPRAPGRHRRDRAARRGRARDGGPGAVPARPAAAPAHQRRGLVRLHDLLGDHRLHLDELQPGHGPGADGDQLRSAGHGQPLQRQRGLRRVG